MDIDNYEIYSFSHTDEGNITTNISFTVPPGANIATFHEMCRKFAAAVGYAEKSITEYFGEWNDEAFEEFL